MEEQQRLDKGERERSSKELEYFRLRQRVDRMIAMRPARFFVPLSEGGASSVYGKEEEPEAPRTDGQG